MFIRLSMIVRPRWCGSPRPPQAWMIPAGSRNRSMSASAAALAAADALMLRFLEHERIGRGEGRGTGDDVPVEPPRRHARKRVEEAQVVSVEVDPVAYPGRKAGHVCPRGVVIALLARELGSEPELTRPEARRPAVVGPFGQGRGCGPVRIDVAACRVRRVLRGEDRDVAGNRG